MKIKKLSFFCLILLNSIIKSSKEDKELNEHSITNKKINLRHLWNEDIDYDDSGRNPEEQQSINHCRNSDYKYFIFYVEGQSYEFKEFIERSSAVSNIIITKFNNI